MKKLVLFLTVVMMMAFSSICMAADGIDLGKEQRAANTFITAVTSNRIVYDRMAVNLSDGLKNKIDKKTFTELKNNVKTKMGNLEQVRFYSFERLQSGGQQDKLTYVASFSNEKIVVMVFVFNKDSKITEISLVPLQPQAQQTDTEAQTAQQAQ